MSNTVDNRRECGKTTFSTRIFDKVRGVPWERGLPILRSQTFGKGKVMSKATSNLYEISEEGGQLLGEVVHLLEAEGKENLPLTRRVRRAHERLLRNGQEGQERAADGETGGTSQPTPNELEATCATQHAALQQIASGVRPSRGDQRPTMLTIREARTIAQSVLHRSGGEPEGREKSERSPTREAERLQSSMLSGDLHAAKRQAQMILERDETLESNEAQGLLLDIFARTLLGCLEGKVGVDLRRAATSSLVRLEQEARQTAERRAEAREQEAAKLRQTLAWYAEETNYRPLPETPGIPEHMSPKSRIEDDLGQMARQSLNEIEAGSEVSQRFEAAEKTIEQLRAALESYEQQIAELGAPDSKLG